MSAAVATFVRRLQGDGTIESNRLRERLVALGIVLMTGYLGLSIAEKFATVFIAVVGMIVLLLMIDNQEKTLYLLLWFSTIYFLLKALVLKWSNLAFLFKEGFLGLLIAFWVFHFFLRQEKFPHSIIHKPLVVFVGWLLLQAFNPNNISVMAVADSLRYWLGALAVFVLTIHLVDTPEKMERGLKFVFLYASLAMLYGLAQQFFPRDLLITLGADPTSYFYFADGAVRSFSTMGTVPFALLSSMFPCLAFFYASQQRNPLFAWLYTALGFGFIAAVLFTLVRASWIATALSVLAYAVATRRWRILLVVVVAIVLIGVFARGYMYYKVQGLLNPEDDPSIRARMSIARTVSQSVAFRAFGYGLGTFANSRWAGGDAEAIGYGTTTENWYLMVVLELGWVGIGLLFWIWFKMYRLAWLSYKGGLRSPRYRELAMGLAGGLFAIEISRMGGPSGYFPPDSWHYWFFAALLVSLPRFDAELQAREAAAGPGQALPARTTAA